MRKKSLPHKNALIAIISIIADIVFIFLWLALDVLSHSSSAGTDFSDAGDDIQTNPGTSSTVSIQALAPSAPVDSVLPFRLKIPKIKVNALFEYVGLTKDGAVGAPKAPERAAWFNVSPRPGEIGNTIITGHFGPWLNGRKSVFNYINLLKQGDIITVTDKKGAAINFVVREIRLYGQNDSASEVFVSTDGKSHLNLITCEGVWNKVTKRYSNRLVVFADRQ